MCIRDRGAGEPAGLALDGREYREAEAHLLLDAGPIGGDVAAREARGVVVVVVGRHEVAGLLQRPRHATRAAEQIEDLGSRLERFLERCQDVRHEHALGADVLDHVGIVLRSSSLASVGRSRTQRTRRGVDSSTSKRIPPPSMTVPGWGTAPASSMTSPASVADALAGSSRPSWRAISWSGTSPATRHTPSDSSIT